MWYAKFVQAKFHDRFCTITFCFVWPNLFICGNSWYLFPMHWNWHLNFHFKHLVVSYKLSHSEIKDDWISCCLNLTVHSSNSFWPIPHGLLLEKELLKWMFCSFLLRGSWNMLPYTAYVTVLSELENCSKHLAEWLLALQTMCITSSFGRTSTRQEQVEYFCKEAFNNLLISR